MEMATEKSSEILPFINGNNILLTGGTGYVGKLLVEQLLRKCDPNKLYLLIRPKNNVEPTERVKEIFEHAVYDELKKEKPNFFDKVEIISGDASEDNLGLSEESKLKIIENVNLVIHSAATVKFEDPLKIATNINVKGTLSVCKLCHQMKHLKALVHISTAYSNCPNKDINEAFYEPPISCDKLLMLAESLDQEELDILSKKILGKWPNTYCFTKAVAEEVIRKHGQGLPVSIFRPSMILPTSSEPIPGWTDNMYGPVALSIGVGYGIQRVVLASPTDIAEVVPGDMVASAIIVALAETIKSKITKDIKIYNFVTDKSNRISWQSYTNIGMDIHIKMPFEKALLPPGVIFAQNTITFNALVFLLQFLPAILLDLARTMMNKKPIGYKLYKKAKKYFTSFAYFSFKKWNFANDNVVKLWNSLNETDRELFDFNMKSLNWKDYLNKMLKGVRLYVAKETPESIPRAVRKYKRQMFIQKLLLNVIYIGFALLILKIMVITPYLANN